MFGLVYKWLCQGEQEEEETLGSRACGDATYLLPKSGVAEDGRGALWELWQLRRDESPGFYLQLMSKAEGGPLNWSAKYVNC